MNTGRFEDDGDYPVVPASVVDLCGWFNTTTRETCQRQRGVWKDHKIRVEWLGWYWKERERDRAKAFQKRDDLMMQFVRFIQEKEMRERETRERETRERDRREQHVERGDALRLLAEAAERVQDEDEEDKMDLDTDPEDVEQDDSKENGINMENGNGDIENGNHRMGNGYHDRRSSTEEESDDESSRRETVTVNHVGEADPKGLTPKDWDYVEELEDALEIKEDASTEEMVRETVSWAVDVHETGEFAKRRQNQEDQEDGPVNRRTRQVSRTRYDVPGHTRDK